MEESGREGESLVRRMKNESEEGEEPDLRASQEAPHRTSVPTEATGDGLFSFGTAVFFFN